MPPSSRRLLLLLILGTAALRLAAAEGLGLGIDESYMVAAGRTLRWGYFDHPPLAWWLARGASWLFGSNAAVAVRLPFIALFAFSTFCICWLGNRVAGPRAGLWAAAALNVAPMFGLTTGSWVLPDGPLMAALLGGAVLLMQALETPPTSKSSWGAWLGSAVFLGLALLSKYSAVLAPLGLLGFLLTSPAHRPWLRRPQPWVALALALALFSPVLVWNAHHGWVSFAFQGGRAAVHQWHPFGPFAVLGGAALFVLPWIWVGLVVALVRGLRGGPATWRSWLLCWLALPPLVLFPVVALWSRHVLFHWAAPGYLFLFPLLGWELVRLGQARPRLLRVAALASVALMVTGVGVAESEVRWNWLAEVRTGLDPALQARPWSMLGPALARRELLGRPHTVVAGPSWWFTGKLDYALDGVMPVICLDRDAREYGILSPPRAHDGMDVLLIAPLHRAEQDARRFAGNFQRLEPLAPLTVPLPHRPPVTFALFLGHGFKARLEAEGGGGE